MCNSIVLLTTFAILCVTFTHGQSDALFLTPLIASGNISLARNLSLVLTLPNSSIDIPIRQSYSGLITVNDTTNSNLFFWFFPATTKCTDDDKTPILLWLDGGPGVSNFLSIFTQNGPYIVKHNLDGVFNLEPRLEDWTVNRSIIYLESPVDVGMSVYRVGITRDISVVATIITGFSFTSDPAGLPKTSEEAAESSVEFLRQFFLLFPEYITNPFYLAGQSYGGHFAPAVGTALHQRNEESREPRINFHGILLIAPWTNPFLQVDSYADFMYQTALIDERVKDDFVVKQGLIKMLITEERYVEAKDMWTDMLLNPGSTFYEASGFTTALTLLEDQLDPNNFLFANYVESPEFRRAIHVGNLTYTLVSEAIQQSMTEEFMASKSGHIEELLRAGKYKLIVATGQLDLTVIHSGIEKMLSHFVWSGQDEWIRSNRTVWKGENGQVIGYKKEVSNLAFYLIRNAGHMLIGDQPAWNLEFVNEVLNC